MSRSYSMTRSVEGTSARRSLRSVSSGAAATAIVPVMSANRIDPDGVAVKGKAGSKLRSYRFDMPHPIPAYLIISLVGTPDHAVRGDLADEFRKQADDVDAHRRA